jgi:hypothetical protein
MANYIIMKIQQQARKREAKKHMQGAGFRVSNICKTNRFLGFSKNPCFIHM